MEPNVFNKVLSTTYCSCFPPHSVRKYLPPKVRFLNLSICSRVPSFSKRDEMEYGRTVQVQYKVDGLDSAKVQTPGWYGVRSNVPDAKQPATQLWLADPGPPVVLGQRWCLHSARQGSMGGCAPRANQRQRAPRTRQGGFSPEPRINASTQEQSQSTMGFVPSCRPMLH